VKIKEKNSIRKKGLENLERGGGGDSNEKYWKKMLTFLVEYE
jgi:hypothetical protein